VKRFLLAAATTLTLAAAAIAPSDAVAKTCPGGYTRATIGGATKCLHAGEFCARRDQSEYLHYGYTCDDYVDGEYHLERR
jgi:hypothetical protein